MSGKLYTIGYQNLSLQTLERLMDSLDLTLVDIRSSPWSRNPVYRKSNLIGELGDRYVWKGDWLGGRNDINRKGIDWINDRLLKENLLLMCLEEAPILCHRHHAVCAPYFPDALHIYRQFIIKASEVQRALDTGNEDESMSYRLLSL